MIAGGDTAHAMRGFAWRELDCVKVKGKEQPVVIYEPLGPAAKIYATNMENAALFQQMLVCYRASQWDEAEALLTKLEHGESHPLYQLYRNRIAHFRATPPEPEWGGVFVFNRK
jgi:adenylate cyclase